jgi:cytochrome b
MSGIPYNIAFRTQFIDYENYILALIIIRSQYPYITLMEARAKIFNEGITKLIDNMKTLPPIKMGRQK